MKLSIVSHDHIIKFDVAFIFEEPTRLLLQKNELNITYDGNLSGESLV